jgi:glycerol uptake facilitator-like aquaporin
MPKSDLVMMPGCYVDTNLVTPGQAFGMEFISSFFQLFLAFGLGLDPRNNSSFGPSLTPFLIGLSAALTLFSTGMARPGYLGSSNNPARCLGLNAASGDFTYHYNHWAADITAVM